MMLLVNSRDFVAHDLDHLSEQCNTDDIPAAYRVRVQRSDVSVATELPNHLKAGKPDRLRGHYLAMCKHCMPDGF